jgi:predicted transposase YdaD
MAVLWLRFLREVGEQKFVVSDDLMENAEISQALKLCEEGAYTDSQLAAYDAYWDIIRVEKTLIAEGEARGRAEGEARGRAEGEAKGRAEGEARGRAEGEAKGRAEGEAKGRAEGEAKGRAEGEAKGRAEGREEGRAEGEKESIINIVLNCRHNGFSIEQMQTITGLGEEELQEILRSTPI